MIKLTKIAGKLEPCLWVLVMAALGLFSVHSAGVRIYNDSYQYLSVAEVIRTQGKIATSIVFFDTERARGILPAPETTAPPGYPVAIDSLLWTHLSPETAALLISFCSTLSVIPLLWWGAGLVGKTVGVRRVAVAAWVLNAQAIGFSSSILSEGLFTTALLAAVVLLIFSECSDNTTARRAVPAAMALIGLSYGIRYAAILVVPGLIVFICWLAARRNSRFWLWLWSLPICLGPIAYVMIRNLHIAGTWRGGNDLAVHNSLWSVLRAFIAVCYLLPFGTARATLGLGVCIAVVILAILVLLFTSGRNKGNGVLLRSPVPLLFFLVTGYCTGLIYLGTSTMISFNTRYFLPIYPEFILLCTVVVIHYWLAASEPGIRRTVRLLGAIAMFGYAFLNIYSIYHFSLVPKHVTLLALFAEPTPDGVPLKRWVDSRIPAEAPVLATDGQATAYILHRPTIAMAEQAFSKRRWDEKEVQQTMSTYHAKYLIIYPGLSPEDSPEQQESQFLLSLIDGEHPSWLIPMVRTLHVAIFEMRTTDQDISITGRMRPE
jgi:hypothetical protein